MNLHVDSSENKITITTSAQSFSLPMNKVNNVYASYNRIPPKYVFLPVIVVSIGLMHVVLDYMWFVTTLTGGLTVVFYSLLFFCTVYIAYKQGKPVIAITTVEGMKHVVHVPCKEELDLALAEIPNHYVLKSPDD